MLKHDITYTDVFTNTETTKTFYFHLNAPELFRIIGHSGSQDWEDYANEVLQSGDSERIMDLIESFVLTAVGERIDNRFVKNSTIKDEFAASEAYANLFVELITDSEFAKTFFSSLIADANAQKGNDNNVQQIGNRQQRRNRNNNKNNNKG